MKYIRLASDLHLDHDYGKFHKTRLFDPLNPIKEAMDFLWYPPVMPDDLETTFVVAGDIWINRNFARHKDLDGKSWIEKMSAQFKYVVLVLGNHDYWDGNLSYESDKSKAAIAELGLTNTFLLEIDCIVLDQVKFIGGCLWTDYHRGDPLVMHDAQYGGFDGRGLVKDYRFIGSGPTYKKVKPYELALVHEKTKKFIFENATKDAPDQTVVVVTHMAPSYESVNQKYRDTKHSIMNFLYYSDLDYQILAEGQEIDYWFHGHMHSAARYRIGNVKVHLNPKGYPGEDTKFNDKFLIEV